MKRLVEFRLDDGSSVLVESLGPAAEERLTRSGLPEGTVEKARLSFEEAIDKIKPATAAVISRIRSLVEGPDEVTVEFGIKLDAQAGAIIASAGVEANYKVALKWTRDLGSENPERSR